jgi:hypothetical protein
MQNASNDNNLSLNQENDIEELIRFLREEVRIHAEEKYPECLSGVDKAIDILEVFGQGNIENKEEIILRSRIEDDLGYNGVQLKLTDKEIEIAHIVKYLCTKGQNKTRNRLFYLDCQGNCENYVGSWNGIGEVLADLKNFLKSNEWKLSIG